jgi:hypothetical protein
MFWLAWQRPLVWRGRQRAWQRPLWLELPWQQLELVLVRSFLEPFISKILNYFYISKKNNTTNDWI